MLLDRQAVSDLALGAAFLGSGGGGDPYYATLLAEAELEQRGTFEVIGLDMLDDDALVVPCGWIGAPTVSVEKLPNGREAVDGLKRLEQLTGRRIDAVIPIEIGGSNGLAPLFAAARLGVPVLDCDGMGRAFPESQMAIFNIRGLSACPSILTDASGSLGLIETPDNLAHERLARHLSIAAGGIAHLVEYPLSGRQAKDHAIHGTITAARNAGAAIREARGCGQDPFAALFAALERSGLYPHAGVLFDGKITDIERETRNGFSVGRVTLESFDGASTMEMDFQNENLLARRDGAIVAMVPDILTVMDRETADTITTERLKYGQRVKVVAAAAPAILREERALRFVGPRAFRYPLDYKPVEEIGAWLNA